MIDLAKIHKGMDVVTSDGQRIGTVRELLEQMMFLNETASVPQGRKATIPMTWITGVDEVVHLAKSYDQTQHYWQAGSESSL